MTMFRYVSMIFKQLDAKVLNGTNRKIIKTTSTRNLSNLTVQQTQDFLNSFDVVLSDCDGVLWHITKPIPGALDTLKRLQDLGKRVYLVTNNSTRTADQYCEKVRRQGLILKPEQVINTAKVIAWYLNKINFQDEAFVIACSEFRQVLTDSGIKLAPERPNVNESDHVHTVKCLQNVAAVRAVVIDFSLSFDWVKLAFAISCLRRDDVLYLTGVQDEWITVGDDRKLIGSGPMINVVTKHSGRTPIRCAKPSYVLKDYVLDVCRIEDPKRCLFIGDTLNYDMKFAAMCGFLKLLVETGLNKKEDVEESETRPDLVLSSLGTLFPMIDSIHSKSLNQKTS